jgi:hypothetical protein
MWNALAMALGTPLEIFYVVVAVAAGIGLCIVSDHRGRMMGLLSLFMAFLAIIAARVVQTHLFVFPEWKKVVHAVEVPLEYEQFYMTMLGMGGRNMRIQMRQEAAEQNSGLVATAIAALILDKRIEPVVGQDLYLAAHWKVDQMEHPLNPDTADLTLDKPALTEAWAGVADYLRQWDDQDKRTTAASQYYFRKRFLVDVQCNYKAVLDDYPTALTMGFFKSSGCIFFMLRLVYCLIGLIGAYKTCSQSFME